MSGRIRPDLFALFAVSFAAAVFVTALHAGVPQGTTPTSGGPTAQDVTRSGTPGVTAVEGSSTLHHLGLTIEQSTMGWDGQWGPPPSNQPLGANAPTRAEQSTGRFLLSGADLYRISCRACHKPNGTGAPPEINSLIGPVQSASAKWMTERMKAAGRPVDSAFIRQLTSSTEADLRKRLKAGGHNMPSFDHLSDVEIAVLRPYLDELAGLPGATARPRRVAEQPNRVGELIVKGTCHICHDATGTNQRTTVLSGVILPLAGMPQQKTVGQFVQKVLRGAPVPLGASDVMSRGRMPVFNYLSESEIVAAYSYLIAYPPK